MIKKLLLWLGAIVSIVALGLGALMAATFMGRRSVVDGHTIGDVRLVVDGFAVVGVVPTGVREVLLVDAGEDANAAAIEAELSRRGLTADAVSAILLTHGHLDHTGGARHFPKARVMSLDTEVPVIEGRLGTNGPATRLFPTNEPGITVARSLRDGETLTLGSATVRVFAMPGHTAGSAAYLINGALFIGDSGDITSDGALQGAPWLFSDSQEQNRASLGALAERLTREQVEVRAIVPAHSGPADGAAPLLAFAK